ncbi:hypothetical protein [Pilimelia columellifera]|uniref:Integral membrane protein n=1 Tax=Pilimelia columellifera subsp. columellifera TaxID=706583 RepID=A0ABN3NLS2_9ACTN
MPEHHDGPHGPGVDARDAELARLRAEVRQLRARQTGRASRAGRWVASIVVMLTALALGVTAVGAVFARNQLLDTDRYMAAVSPLVHDPVIQDALANRITTEVVTHVDLESIATQASAWLTAQGAPPQVNALVRPAVSGARSFIHSTIRKLVATPQFARAWDAANRTAHESLVVVLTGGSSGAISSSGTTVTVDLGVFLDEVKQRLVEAGLTIAARIPAVSIPFTLFASDQLPALRTYVRWLDQVATWLPWVALTLLLVGIGVAPQRRRGLLVAGLVVAGGLLLLRLGIAAVQDLYLDRLPPEVPSPEAARQVMTALTGGVRDAVTAIIVVAGMAALVAWLTGPSQLAVALRRGGNWILDALGRALGHAQLPIGGTSALADRSRRPIQVITAVVAAALLLVAPSVTAGLWLATAALAVVVAVEVLARTPTRAGTPTD